MPAINRNGQTLLLLLALLLVAAQNCNRKMVEMLVARNATISHAWCSLVACASHSLAARRSPMWYA